MDDKVKKQKDEEKVEGKKEENVTDELEESDSDETAALTARVAELEDLLKRSVADYRNLENRVREEKLEFIKFANKNLLEELLPAFDTLLLAEKYTEDNNFKITVKHVLDVLKNIGINRVEAVGKKFDPVTMEAVEVMDGEKDMVLDETQPGFMLNGKVLRPARVKVGKGKIEN
ncbi:MAG: nucleotide exchange factor GrpE [Candidatus Levyibacteriota bacterium]